MNRSSLQLGVVQGLLIWAFIPDWAYVLPGLLFTAALGSARTRSLWRFVLGTGLGLLAGLPYLLHLVRDYNPAGAGEMPQIWRDQMGERLNGPYWWSLDMAPLLVLFVLGLVLSYRSVTRDGLGFLLTGPMVALC